MELPTDFDEILRRAGGVALHFGDDPHYYPDPGVRSGSRSGSGKNCHNSIMLAFGGGLCPLSTSGLFVRSFVDVKQSTDHKSSCRKCASRPIYEALKAA